MYISQLVHHVLAGAPAGFKNVDAQPVGSGASLREMIRNIDNYFAIG